MLKKRKRVAWNKGIPLSSETKAKISRVCLGLKRSLETREKISKARLGKVMSLETREKIGKVHLGKTVSLETRAKISKGNLGQVMSPEAREKISKAFLGNTYHKGHKHSLETREKMGKAHLGNTHLKGHKHSQETRVKMSKSRLKYLEDNESTFKYRDTKPEKLVEAYLKKLGVKYIKQKLIAGSPVDFYLPNLKTIVEVDGCIWHACSKCYPKPDGWFCKTYEDVVNVHMKDALKDNKCLDKGYKVIRIWEHEILDENFKVLGDLNYA